MLIVKSDFYIINDALLMEQTDILERSCDSMFVDIDRLLPVIFSPSRKILPSVGLYTPVSILNTVVLPAPFGPIKPYN